MATSGQLIRGAYGAAGGGIKGLGTEAGRGLAKISDSWRERFEPIWEKKAETFNKWAQNDLQDKINAGGVDNKLMKELQNTYKVKRWRYLMGDKSMQAQIMQEMAQDKAELEKNLNLQKSLVEKADPKNPNGFSKNLRFLGGPVAESLMKFYEGAPKRNSKNQLGGMIYDPEIDKERFYTTAEIEDLMRKESFDQLTQAKIDGLLTATNQESLSLDWSSNMYDWNGNYGLIESDIVNPAFANGTGKSLNEMNTLGPDMTFEKSFKAALMNNNYESVGVTPPGENEEGYEGEATLSDFTRGNKRDARRLQRKINRAHKKVGDDDMSRISPEDAEKIYQELIKNERLNKKYLTAFLTNFAENNWMKQRWNRKDAPRKEDVYPGEIAEGVYKGVSGDPWDYKMEDGKWHTRKREEGGSWIDISNNKKAVDILNKQWPDAIASEEDETLENIQAMRPTMDNEFLNAESAENLRRIRNGEPPMQAGDPWYEEYLNQTGYKYNKYIPGQTNF